MDCRVQIRADRGYSATQPFPIQLVLAGRNADTTAEADVSETDKYGTCIETRQFNTYALKVRFTRGTQFYRTGAGAIHCPSRVARAFAFALPRRRDVFSFFA